MKRFRVEFALVRKGYYEIEAKNGLEATAIAQQRYHTESNPTFIPLEGEFLSTATTPIKETDNQESLTL